MKIRGTPAQILEKYLTLARDATSSDDRITAENYLQHAEHYYRVLNVDGERKENRGRNNGAEGGNGDDREASPAVPARQGASSPAAADPAAGAPAATDPAVASQPVVTESKPSGPSGDPEGKDGGDKEPVPA